MHKKIDNKEVYMTYRMTFGLQQDGPGGIADDGMTYTRFYVRKRMI